MIRGRNRNRRRNDARFARDAGGVVFVVGTTDHDVEFTDDPLQLGHLLVEFGGGGGRLLSGRGIRLGNLVHVGHRAGDLEDSLALLVRSRRDLADDIVDLAGSGRDFVEALGDTFADLRALLGTRGGIRDLLRRLTGSLDGTLRQRADLVGNDREAETGVAGAGGFDGRVQREDV